jgi:hypothetical protein
MDADMTTGTQLLPVSARRAGVLRSSLSMVYGGLQAQDVDTNTVLWLVGWLLALDLLKQLTVDGTAGISRWPRWSRQKCPLKLAPTLHCH